MALDSELIHRLREFLRNSDLNTTTTGIVRRKLEEDFGLDFSDKKVDLFLQSELQKAKEADGEATGDGDENKVDGDSTTREEEDGEDDEEDDVDRPRDGKEKVRIHPSNKRRIICDEKLKDLFDVESFNGFTVSKLLTSSPFMKTN